MKAKKIFKSILWIPLFLPIFYLFYIRYYAHLSFVEVLKVTLQDEISLGFSIGLAWFLGLIGLALTLGPQDKKLPPFKQSQWLDVLVMAWFFSSFLFPFIGWLIAGTFTLSFINESNWHTKLAIRTSLGLTPLILISGPLTWIIKTRNLKGLWLILYMALPALGCIATPLYDLFKGATPMTLQVKQIIPLNQDFNHRLAAVLIDSQGNSWRIHLQNPARINSTTPLKGTALKGLRLFWLD